MALFLNSMLLSFSLYTLLHIHSIGNQGLYRTYDLWMQALTASPDCFLFESVSFYWFCIWLLETYILGPWLLYIITGSIAVLYGIWFSLS